MRHTLIRFAPQLQTEPDRQLSECDPGPRDLPGVGRSGLLSHRRNAYYLGVAAGFGVAGPVAEAGNVAGLVASTASTAAVMSSCDLA